MMKHVYTLLFILMWVAAPLAAQPPGYSPGIMVTFTGDTLATHIRVVNGKSLKKIGYINERGKKRRFSARHIKAYRIDGQLGFFSISPRRTQTKARVFAKIEAEGQLRLLYYPLHKAYYLVGKNEVDAKRITKWAFRNRVVPYIHANADLQESVVRRRLKFRDLRKIVESYNTWYEAFYKPYINTAGQHEAPGIRQ